MDNHPLLVCDAGGHHPDWALEAVRQGARAGLALLRTPRLPELVVLTGRRLRDRTDELAPGTELVPAGDPREDASHHDVSRPAAHTPTSLYVSFPGVLSAYLPEGPCRPAQAAPALAFAAGGVAARFADTWASVERPETGPRGELDRLFPAVSLETGALLSRLVGAVASGFRLAPKDLPCASRTAVFRFFLTRLDAIEAEEGRAALFRGALGRTVRCFVREVRLARTPGQVGASGFGLAVDGFDDVLALLDWHRDQRPWPFADRLL